MVEKIQKSTSDVDLYSNIALRHLQVRNGKKSWHDDEININNRDAGGTVAAARVRRLSGQGSTGTFKKR